MLLSGAHRGHIGLVMVSKSGTLVDLLTSQLGLHDRFTRNDPLRMVCGRSIQPSPVKFTSAKLMASF